MALLGDFYQPSVNQPAGGVARCFHVWPPCIRVKCTDGFAGANGGSWFPRAKQEEDHVFDGSIAIRRPVEATFFGTVLHLIPAVRPFFPPCHPSSAGGAVFLRFHAVLRCKTGSKTYHWFQRGRMISINDPAHIAAASLSVPRLRSGSFNSGNTMTR